MKKVVRILLLVIMSFAFILGGFFIVNGVMPIISNGFSLSTPELVSSTIISAIYIAGGAAIIFDSSLLMLFGFLKKRFSSPILRIQKVAFYIGTTLLITAVVPLVISIAGSASQGQPIYLYVGDLLYILIGFLFIGFNAACYSAFKKRSFLPFFIYACLDVALGIAYILLNGNFYTFDTQPWYTLILNILMLVYLAIAIGYLVISLILSIQDPSLFIHRKLEGKEYTIKKINKRGQEVLRVYDAKRGKLWLATFILGCIGGGALFLYSILSSVKSLSTLTFEPILITDINNIPNVIDVFTSFYPLTYIPISLLFIYGLIFRDGYYYHNPLKVRSFISLFFAASIGHFLVQALNHNYDFMAILPLACYLVAVILKYISLWSSGPAMADLRKGESFKENARVLLGPMICSSIAAIATSVAYLIVSIYLNTFDYTVIIFLVAAGFLLLFSIFESITPLEESFIYKRLPQENNEEQ